MAAEGFQVSENTFAACLKIARGQNTADEILQTQNVQKVLNEKD